MERRLSAILAADMVGYSRLMEADEVSTLERQKAHRKELIDPAFGKYHGRIVKEMGDGVLVEFPSVVEAVQCAAEIQRGMSKREAEISADRRIAYRIGINLGDIVVDGDDIQGDGVNVAARLEALAEPSGICISGTAYDQMRSTVEVGYESLGEVKVKNIQRPIRAYKVLTDPAHAGIRVERRRQWFAVQYLLPAGLVFLLLIGASGWWWQPWRQVVSGTQALTLPDRPSIAVLPFDNLSSDVEQGYFADGISEDIIIGLSKLTGIFVIARNSSFAYRGDSPDARQVSRDLGVRYVLSGSVRRDGNNLRVTASLVDAVKDNNVWAERYDRQISDVFEVQSEISKQVVRALSVTLKASEQERLFRPHTTSLVAYDLFLRARKTHLIVTQDTLTDARRMYEHVIELDPKFAGGYAGLSTVLAVGARLGFSTDRKGDGRKALELAQEAISIDPDFGWSYVALGGAWTVLGDPQAAVEAVRRGVELQPNDADAQLFLGWYLTFAGQSAQGIAHIKKAMRLDPIRTNRQYFFLGVSLFVDGEAAEAVSALEDWRAFSSQPIGEVFLAAAYAAAGDNANAKRTAAELLKQDQNFDLAKWQFVNLFAREDDREHILRSARAAGIPDSTH